MNQSGVTLPGRKVTGFAIPSLGGGGRGRRGNGRLEALRLFRMEKGGVFWKGFEQGRFFREKGRGLFHLSLRAWKGYMARKEKEILLGKGCS